MRRLQCSQSRVTQKSAADAFSLPILMHGETREKHDWNRMSRKSFPEPFRGSRMFNLTYSEAVIADDRIVHQADVCLGCICALVLERVSFKPFVQLRLPAVEIVQDMFAPKFLDGARVAHGLEEKKPGLRRSAFN